jgi:hypothetical protein
MKWAILLLALALGGCVVEPAYVGPGGYYYDRPHYWHGGGYYNH